MANTANTPVVTKTEKVEDDIFANSGSWSIASYQKVPASERVRLRLPDTDTLAAIMKRWSYKDRLEYGVPVHPDDPTKAEHEEAVAAEKAAKEAKKDEPKLGRPVASAKA